MKRGAHIQQGEREGKKRGGRGREEREVRKGEK